MLQANLLFRLGSLGALFAAAQATSIPPAIRIEVESLSGGSQLVALAEFDLDRFLEGDRLTPVRFLPRIPDRPVAVHGALDSDSDRMVVSLIGGDSLAGRIGGGRDEQLLVEGPDGAPIPISIDGLISVVFPARLPDDPGVSVERPSEGDRLYRLVKEQLDRVDGTLDSFTPQGVRFESLIGMAVVPWEELAALFIEPLGLGESELAPSGRTVSIDLADGSRLGGKLLRLDESGVGLELPGETRILVGLEHVLAVSSRDGRLTYLSELEPDVVQEGSAFGDELGMVFRHRMDRAVAGGALRVGDQLYPRGIGVQAPSRLEWNLTRAEGQPGWQRLRGAVGIDQSVASLGLQGSVRFAIELDGQEVWTSEVIDLTDGRVEWAPIDVDGHSRLALVTYMEQDWNVGDAADWVDARLLTAGAE